MRAHNGSAVTVDIQHFSDFSFQVCSGAPANLSLFSSYEKVLCMVR